MLNDIRYGFRMLWKKPAFTLVAVVSLALGIGANTAIFSVTDRLLLRSLPVSDPDQLVRITSVSVNPHFVSNSFSYPLFNDFRTQNKVFDGLVAFTRTELETRINADVERIPSEYVSGNYFDVLGIQAARGRTFLPEEQHHRHAADRHSATLRSQRHRSVYFCCDCVAPDSSFAVGLLPAGAPGDEGRPVDGAPIRVRPYANTEDRRDPA